MTIYENLEMGASSKAAKAAKKDTIERIYNWFPKLKDRKNQLAGTLSGGEQQMLAFSRGMMGLPKLLIMDEPSLGLAPTIVGATYFPLPKRWRRNPAYHYPGGTGCEEGAEDCQQGIRD